MRHFRASCLIGLALVALLASAALAQSAAAPSQETAPAAEAKAPASPADSQPAAVAPAAPTASAAPAKAPDAAPILDGATLDPPHTSAAFWIRHIVAPVAGRFNVVSGAIAIPAKDMGKGRVEFTVTTQSVDTGVAARDTHLRTAEFLDVAAYPAMTFAGSRIAPAGKDKANVTGTLTIKDVAKSVTIPVRLLGTKPHPMMPCVDVTGYEASFPINRLEYHVGTGKYFKLGAVGDVVDIRVSGETLAARPGCVKPQ